MTDKDRIGVWIHGSSGRMGVEIQEILLTDPQTFRILGGSSRKFEGEIFHQGKPVTADLLGQSIAKNEIKLILDFSTDEANKVLLDACEQHDVCDKALLIGTTGLSKDIRNRWRKLSKEKNLRILMAPNTSLGILMTMQYAMQAAGILHKQGFDIEIVETHHREKRDAPSGTANFIASSVATTNDSLVVRHGYEGKRDPNDIGVHAVRGGSIFGEHQVRFIGDDEEFTIEHRALTRTLFARGAVTLSRWLSKQKKAGFFGLRDIKLSDI